MRKLPVTGSSGSIGSEVCAYFEKRGWKVHGIDHSYSDPRKMKPQCPARRITRSLEQMFQEIVQSWRERSRGLEGMGT